MNATDRRIEYRAARVVTTAVSIATVLMATLRVASAQTVRPIYEVIAEKNVPGSIGLRGKHKNLHGLYRRHIEWVLHPASMLGRITIAVARKLEA